MSQITTQLLSPEALAKIPASKPVDNIFRSFNALDPNVFDNLLGNLRRVTPEKISKHVTITDDSNKFESEYLEHTSSRESKQEFSLSIGVKGKYGVFSASANFKNTTVEVSSFTALYATYSARLNMGTIALNAMPRAAMLNLLHPDMVSQLRAIDSLADAQDFTNTWGTHLVTRVRTGGMLFVSMSEETSSNTSRNTVSREVKAKYKKVVSLETAISVTNDISRNETTKNVSQSLIVLGGDNKKAAVIDPADKNTVSAWLKSVTTNTTFAVADSIEIFTLVTGTARTMLKKYLDLTMLAFSIEHPIIFATGTAIRAGHPSSVAAPAKATRGFKIVGGGAATTTGTSRNNNFLMGSYPQTTGGRPPAAWLALSHDWVHSAAAGDVLTSYAIAIHDPENYLEVTVAQGRGSRTGKGSDTAQAKLPPGSILTCGGVYSRTMEGVNKFVTASYFSNAETWVVANTDYRWEATNVELHAYVVGIKSKDPLLTIEVDMQAGTEEHSQMGNPTVRANGGVCGGGVLVIQGTGPGNLVQACWPSTPMAWKASNTFLDRGLSTARSQAYVLSLHAKIEI